MVVTRPDIQLIGIAFVATTIVSESSHADAPALGVFVRWNLPIFSTLFRSVTSMTDSLCVCIVQTERIGVGMSVD